MDVEVLTMTYASVDDLFRDLRQNGAAARCTRVDAA